MKYHDNPAIVLIDDQPFGGSTEPAANLDTQTFTRLTLKVKVRLKGSNTKVIVTIYEGDQDEAAPDHQATVQEETSGTGEVTVRAKTFAINTIADGTAETLKVAVAAVSADRDED